MELIADFIKTKRKLLGLTQEDLAEKAGVALTVIRKMEQRKDNLSLSKVNQVLALFGYHLAPQKLDINENSTVNYNNIAAGTACPER